ncbi:helix-turn-helix domain-containing protein [Brevundimonas diminuta]|jgi:transcriptional regulator with XRE-family HTH domain
MRAEGLTDLQAADAVGVSRPYLTRLRLGERRPSLHVALRIQSWSKGRVPASALGKALLEDRP